MFSDRSNDGKIKEEVYPDATVPTIYEYIVGLAWYYFSNKRIDLLNSFNLTLSANFEPLTHAGGGMGDIVIYEEKQVIMLEATLMNANSQKRGEWEPVLRHSVNLKIDEESSTNRELQHSLLQIPLILIPLTYGRLYRLFRSNLLRIRTSTLIM